MLYQQNIKKEMIQINRIYNIIFRNKINKIINLSKIINKIK